MMNSKENTNSNSSKFGEESENIDEDIPSIHLVCVLVANFNFSISNILKHYGICDTASVSNNLVKLFDRMRNLWMGLCRM